MSAQEQRLSGALQENILTLLCFDDKSCKLIRAAVTPQLFESAVFKEVATHAIDFIDQHGAAIKEHLPDSIEHILKGDDKRKASSFKRLVDSLFSSKDSVNADYVVSQLQKFVRQQNLKSAIVKAVEAMEDGRIDAAEVEMQKGLSSQVVSFSPGLNFSDPDQLSTLMEDLEEPGFDLGIPELDDRGIIPRRKELMMLIGPRGRGKSWFLIHCAKFACLQRWSTVIITLEMSEKRYGARCLQAFFSIASREAEVTVARLVKDREGNLQEVLHEQVQRITMDDPKLGTFLAKRVRREFVRRPSLYIKQFPTKGATLPMIEAYLDGLERFENFIPDCIIIDYPDLLSHDMKNKRLELGEIIEGIRGLCVKRNAAGIVVSQPNAEGEKATTITGNQVAEDLSKLGTVDVMLTYNQTPAEKKLGLARVWVDKARNGKDKFMVLLTQAYELGQWALDSCFMGTDYWDLVGSYSNRNDDD